jgi:hypothetical protein
MTTRGVRNNNPGNIIKSSIQWTGEKNSLNESVFEVFDTPEHGIQALAENLLRYQSKHNIKTIEDCINRWAPPHENNTIAYVDEVSRQLGVTRRTELDFSDPTTLRALTNAIGRYECNRAEFDAYYTDVIIDNGIAAALGIRAQDVVVKPQEPVESTQTQPRFQMPAMLLSLLPMIFQVFAPRAEAQLQRITGQSPEVVEKFTRDLFNTAGQALGVVPPTAQVTTDAQAVQIVAKLQEAKTQNAALVQQ